MAQLTIRKTGTADEVRKFVDRGQLELFQLGDHAVARAVFEKGWKWSQHVKPLAGTPSCESAHTGYCLSGSMVVVMDDGERAQIGPGDFFSIAPGHDAWVVGDAPCVMLDFTGMRHYAEQRGARPGQTAQAPDARH